MSSIWISDFSGIKSILRSRSYKNKTLIGRNKPRDSVLITKESSTYLFLETEGDAADWSLLNALHKVTGEAGNLVSKFLSLDDCNVVDDSLVYMEVGGEPTEQNISLTRPTHDATTK